MTTAVVAYEASSLNDRMKYAQTLSSAGDLIPKGLWNPTTNVDGVVVPSAPSPGKVLLVIETGAMLGLHPAAALQSINVIEGKPSLSAQLIAALIRNAGNRLVITKTGSIPTGDYRVHVVGTIVETGESFESTWDIDRAIRAGLVTSYEPNAAGVWEVRARTKDGVRKPWEAYAEVMPVWRAISEVGREGFSHVTFGLYSTEELTDGGIPILEPEPEPSEDWIAAIAAATSIDDLVAVGDRLALAQEGTDRIRAAYRARNAALLADEQIVDVEIVVEEPGAKTPVADVAPEPVVDEADPDYVAPVGER